MVKRTCQRITELLILLEVVLISTSFKLENQTVEISKEQAVLFSTCTVISYTDRMLNLHIEIVLNASNFDKTVIHTRKTFQMIDKLNVLRGILDHLAKSSLSVKNCIIIVELPLIYLGMWQTLVFNTHRQELIPFHLVGLFYYGCSDKQNKICLNYLLIFSEITNVFYKIHILNRKRRWEFFAKVMLLFFPFLKKIFWAMFCFCRICTVHIFSKNIFLSIKEYAYEIFTVNSNKGGSPFSKCESPCKIRSLSMRSTSCCKRPYVFVFSVVIVNNEHTEIRFKRKRRG